MLELKGVGKRYGKTQVLNGVDAHFELGVTVITGPSGAGKSTLLRLCASVEKPSDGSIDWKGKPLRSSLDAFRRRLGYAPQRIDFPDDLTGSEFMHHVAALKHLPLAAGRSQSSELLQRLGLMHAADRRIAAWSGGMRRRLGLAQACLGAPDVLVLDEPTAELDSMTAGHVNDLIFELANRAVVLMTTHLEDSLAGRTYQPFDVQPIS